MKAWFVSPCSEDRGYVLHAANRNDARADAFVRSFGGEMFGTDRYIDIAARRFPELDDKPITVQTMISAGIDMTFEGELIDSIDIPCMCTLCTQERQVVIYEVLP